MVASNELWLIDDLPIDDPSDLLTIPEIKQHVAHDLRDEDLGLRSLLERPEALSKSLRRDEHARTRRAPSKSAKRHPDALRAA
jgi:hypothetical protein